MPTRRSLLRNVLSLSAVIAAHPPLRAFSQHEPAPSIDLETGEVCARVPADFLGLGYEMSSPAQPGLLSAGNIRYVQLVRNLASQGVLRLGGIVADYTRYQASGPFRAEPKDTVITRESLQQLRGFLDATNWTAIWSLNFGAGTLAQGLAEARAVSAILGPRLLAIELGNEVENYSRGDHPLRPSPYTFAKYLAEYRSWRAQILAAVPGLRFAAPDTAASVEWVEQMAAQARGEVQLLTTHYYRGDQRKASLEQLSEPDEHLEASLRRLRAASTGSGVPWRMCETNSFFGGGRPGLSDTFAGAMWTLNYLLLLAQEGCAGVNIETGVNQLGFLSSYSPIRTQGLSPEPGPPYYGMLAFSAADPAGAGMRRVSFRQNCPGLRAYAFNKEHADCVVVLNWSAASTYRLRLTRFHSRPARILRLTAPHWSSTTGITLGGRSVDSTGQWKPDASERLDNSQLTLPPMSAAIVQAG